MDAERNIALARERVAAAFTLLREAPFVWTDPIGPPGQPRFLNGAWLIETTLELPDALSAALRQIEADLGRVRTGDKYAPRPIDLDLVMWDGVILDPDVHTRPFLRDAVQFLGVTLP